MSPPSFTVRDNAPEAAAPNSRKKYTDKGCTCGQCKLGWLSPRMLYHLQSTSILPSFTFPSSTLTAQAHLATETMSKAVELGHLLSIDLLPYSNFIPPSIDARHLHSAFYRGFISVFRTARDLLARAPTPIMINAEILKAHAPRDSETAYFFSKGGKAEHVLDAIALYAGVRAEEEDDVECFRELPPCRHDQNFATVRKKMGLASDRSWGPYYHVECDGKDWEAGGNVRIRRSDSGVKATSRPATSDLGDVIDWGEGMNASEMEASDRALHELNKFLEQLLPGKRDPYIRTGFSKYLSKLLHRIRTILLLHVPTSHNVNLFLPNATVSTLKPMEGRFAAVVEAEDDDGVLVGGAGETAHDRVGLKKLVALGNADSRVNMMVQLRKGTPSLSGPRYPTLFLPSATSQVLPTTLKPTVDRADLDCYGDNAETATPSTSAADSAKGTRFSSSDYSNVVADAHPTGDKFDDTTRRRPTRIGRQLQIARPSLTLRPRLIWPWQEQDL
ncbi:hypothetical protein BDZ89DRAFT_1120075 [Hymenopellis radicata]|nr:hypothetical protein BDZ89DRAFT_1120075 [Hymenopellis radicata]